MKKYFLIPTLFTILLTGCAVETVDRSYSSTEGFYTNVPADGSVTIIQQQVVPVYTYPGYNPNYYNYHYPRGTYFPYRPPRLGDHPPCRHENCERK